jgi:hypothetical protein
MKTTFIAIWTLLSATCTAQEVMKLNAEDTPGKGTLDQLHWLAGYWTGTGFGGECDEIWMPASDNSMQGIFRFAKNGQINFTEYMVIEEADSTLTVRLKHFARDLSPWEDKEKWVEFKLVKAEGTTAWFNGLTYHREGNELSIYLSLRSENKSRIEEFHFRRTEL